MKYHDLRISVLDSSGGYVPPGFSGTPRNYTKFRISSKFDGSRLWELYNNTKIGNFDSDYTLLYDWLLSRGVELENYDNTSKII